MNKVETIFFRAVALVMIGTSILLMSEYRFFKQQSALLFAAKQDYYNHLTAVKKILSDYNDLKELFEQRDNQDEEKKKSNNGLISADLFPEGARIFSSDDTDDQGTFLVINRELEYLKQSSLEYFKKHGSDILVQRISPDQWCDYNDHVKERTTPAQPKNKKRGTRKRVVSRSAPVKKTVDDKNAVKKDFQFSWPIKRSDFWISSVFGPRKKKNGVVEFHHAIDMAAIRGTPVTAAAEGVVVEAGYKSGYGNTIVIAHNRKYRTRYAHLDKICTRVGRDVKRGELIGRVGHTGSVRSRGGDASHLHFEVHAFGKRVNPIYFLS